MKRNRVMFFVSVGMLVVFTATACGLPALPGSSTATLPPPPATSTTAPEPSPVAIQHLVQPSSGVTAIANAHDNEESETGATEKSVRGGDEFRINRFERPFTATDMTYLPQIDIVGMSMTKDDTWYYVQIKLAGADTTTGEMSGLYGVEFDLNVDGKTEILLVAQGPFGADWTTDGVTAYVDNNGDIGGISSKPDDIYTGNGYETILFDSGKGEDPDAAWARANAANGIVEIAFKQETLRDFPKWMWNPLASAYPIDPTKFYFNDTFTLQRAGSPVKGDNYPLKELAGFDNTCRVPANFEATGTEPMGCQVQAQQDDIEFTPGTGGYPN
ncbi:MAG: hypothetical protein JNM55_21540 [Anaerolineales bacterium]|nr:hypothetical protein [Anaerolineales bacterium]